MKYSAFTFPFLLSGGLVSMAAAKCNADSAVPAPTQTAIAGKAGGYMDSCGRAYLAWVDDHPSLSSICNKGDGTRECVKLDLGLCFANLNGQLVWQQDGRYEYSCPDCKLTGELYKETTLECTCVGSDGVEHQTSIDTNAFIINEHGFLTCHGKGGDRC